MDGIQSLFSDQGLLGAVCLLSFAIIGALWKRLITVTDARLDDIKTHSAELASVAREASRAMDGLTRVLEVKRDV